MDIVVNKVSLYKFINQLIQLQLTKLKKLLFQGTVRKDFFSFLQEDTML